MRSHRSYQTFCVEQCAYLHGPQEVERPVQSGPGEEVGVQAQAPEDCPARVGDGAAGTGDTTVQCRNGADLGGGGGWRGHGDKERGDLAAKSDGEGEGEVPALGLAEHPYTSSLQGLGSG